jgi:hypothetical protein
MRARVRVFKRGKGACVQGDNHASIQEGNGACVPSEDNGSCVQERTTDHMFETGQWIMCSRE